jgi:hypothetical protein
MGREYDPVRKSALLLILPLALAVGCDRRLEPFVPLEDEPPPPERPVRIPGLEKPQARSRVAAPAPARAERDAPAEGAEIRGTIQLGDGADADGQGVVFVIVRSEGGGPPLAVKRLPAGPFPLEFSIGPGDMMSEGRDFSGPMTLTVRVDRDGNPLTLAAGDLSGASTAAVAPGARGVEIRLTPGGG